MHIRSNPGSLCHRMNAPPAEFINLNTEFLVFNTKFIIFSHPACHRRGLVLQTFIMFNAKSLVFDIQFIMFDAKSLVFDTQSLVYNNENSSFLLTISLGFSFIVPTTYHMLAIKCATKKTLAAHTKLPKTCMKARHCSR